MGFLAFYCNPSAWAQQARWIPKREWMLHFPFLAFVSSKFVQYPKEIHSYWVPISWRNDWISRAHDDRKISSELEQNLDLWLVGCGFTLRECALKVTPAGSLSFRRKFVFQSLNTKIAVADPNLGYRADIWSNQKICQFCGNRLCRKRVGRNRGV